MVLYFDHLENYSRLFSENKTKLLVMIKRLNLEIVFKYSKVNRNPRTQTKVWENVMQSAKEESPLNRRLSTFFWQDRNWVGGWKQWRKKRMTEKIYIYTLQLTYWLTYPWILISRSMVQFLRSYIISNQRSSKENIFFDYQMQLNHSVSFVVWWCHHRSIDNLISSFTTNVLILYRVLGCLSRARMLANHAHIILMSRAEIFSSISLVVFSLFDIYLVETHASFFGLFASSLHS